MKPAILLLLCFAALVSTVSFAQPVIISQMVASGNNGGSSLSYMYLTKDKGMIAGGSSAAFAGCEKTENNRDNTGLTNDYWVIKYDSLDNIQWDKTIGGSKGDVLKALQQTYEGGYILGGSSLSNKSGEKSQNSRGYQDYWIVKLSKTGAVEWNRTLGGDSTDILYSLQQTKDSGYIAGGSSASHKSGEKTANNTGSWIVKLDKTGKKQWDRTIEGGGYLIQQTNDGGYILGGSKELIKLDNKGAVQWRKLVVNLNHIPDINAMVQTYDGGYALAGSLDRYNYGVQGWMEKLDSQGNIQWHQQYGNGFFDAYQIFTSFQQTKDHGYILGGSLDAGNIKQIEYWIVKVDKKGTLQWSEALGGSYEDYCMNVIEIRRDRYLVGGSSNSGISGDKTVLGCDVPDYWMLRLDYITPAMYQLPPYKTNASLRRQILTTKILLFIPILQKMSCMYRLGIMLLFH